MLVSPYILRAGARRLLPGTLLILPLAACAGGDLLLPEDQVQLRAVSGSGQTAPVGSPVPHPLVVEAVNGAGKPVEGAVIVFRFVDPPSGAEIAPPVSETGPAGRAEVAVTLGTAAGDQPVEASLDDPQREVSVRFLLTAIATNDGGGDDDDDDPPPPPDDDGSGSPGGGGGGGDDDDDDDAGGGGGGDDSGGGGNDDGGGDGGDGDDEGGGGNGGGGNDDAGGNGNGGDEGRDEDDDDHGNDDDDRDDDDRDGGDNRGPRNGNDDDDDD